MDAFTGGDTESEAKLEKYEYLDIGKWVLLALVIAQGVSLVMALVLRCARRDPEFHNLDKAEERELHMQQIRDDIEERRTGDGGSDRYSPPPSPCLCLPARQIQQRAAWKLLSTHLLATHALQTWAQTHRNMLHSARAWRCFALAALLCQHLNPPPPPNPP